MSNNARNEKQGQYEISTVTLRTVDQAVKDYYDKKLNIGVEDPAGNGRKKVPVIFAGPERWKAIREGEGIRDENGTLILPLISIQRTTIDRTREFGGMASEVPNIVVSRQLSDRTSAIQQLVEMRRANGWPEPKQDVAVYEYLTLPFPDFCTIFYEISIWSQYQSQMNEILEKIFNHFDYKDSFVMPVEYDEKMKPRGTGYYFVGFRDGNIEPSSNFEDFSDDERVVQSRFSIKTPAYLILNPADDVLAYGKSMGEQNSTGAPTVLKQQSVTTISLTEAPVNLSDFLKLSK
jgi:hypothetical protein